MQVHSKVCGFYRLEAAKIVDGKEISRRVVADWFPNLITNGGLNTLATTTGNGDFLQYCSVGSSNTPPLITDNFIGSLIARTSTQQARTYATNSVSPYYSWIKTTYRFAQGTATGNLSEVGVGWLFSATYPLFSHALILDGIGNPTTITILADETLDVLHEYRIYPTETDYTGTVIFTGNIGGTYDWIVRLANSTTGATMGYPSMPALVGFAASNMNYQAIYTSNQNIGAITTQPASLVHQPLAFSYSVYITNDYYVIGTCTLGLNNSNHVGGIRSIKGHVGPQFIQIQFDPAIPKTVNDLVSFTLKTSWGRM